MKNLVKMLESSLREKIKRRLENKLLEFDRRMSYDSYYKLNDEIFLWLEGPQNIIVAQILGSVK